MILNIQFRKITAMALAAALLFGMLPSTPVYAEELPAVTEAAVTEPPVTEPPVTEPPAAEPSAAALSVTEALETEPAVTEPPVTEPPATEPPATEPPATEPPVTESPVTEPPVTEPPATEPPVTEPPATEPVVTEPSATEPAATEPAVITMSEAVAAMEDQMQARYTVPSADVPEESRTWETTDANGNTVYYDTWSIDFQSNTTYHALNDNQSSNADIIITGTNITLDYTGNEYGSQHVVTVKNGASATIQNATYYGNPPQVEEGGTLTVKNVETLDVLDSWGTLVIDNVDQIGPGYVRIYEGTATIINCNQYSGDGGFLNYGAEMTITDSRVCYVDCDGGVTTFGANSSIGPVYVSGGTLILDGVTLLGEDDPFDKYAITMQGGTLQADSFTCNNMALVGGSSSGGNLILNANTTVTVADGAHLDTVTANAGTVAFEGSSTYGVKTESGGHVTGGSVQGHNCTYISNALPLTADTVLAAGKSYYLVGDLARNIDGIDGSVTICLNGYNLDGYIDQNRSVSMSSTYCNCKSTGGLIVRYGSVSTTSNPINLENVNAYVECALHNIKKDATSTVSYGLLKGSEADVTFEGSGVTKIMGKYFAAPDSTVYAYYKGHPISGTYDDTAFDGSFVMPSYRVYIYYTPIQYTITNSTDPASTVTVGGTAVTAAEAGDTVTVTFAAALGSGMQLKVTDADGQEVSVTAVTEGTAYSFTMPASDVTVTLEAGHSCDGQEGWEPLTAEVADGKKYFVSADAFAENLTIPAGVSVTICLNGKSITGNITVDAGGSLTLRDCHSGGSVAAIYQSGSVTLDGAVTVTHHYYSITRDSGKVPFNIYTTKGEFISSAGTEETVVYAEAGLEVDFRVAEESVPTLIKAEDAQGNEIPSMNGFFFLMPESPVTLTQTNEYRIRQWRIGEEVNYEPQEVFYRFDTAANINGEMTDATVILEADLDEWNIPAGFQGTFQGNGHTVKARHYEFGTIHQTANAVIQNLKVTSLTSVAGTFTGENVSFEDVTVWSGGSMTLTGKSGSNEMIVWQDLGGTVSLGSAKYKTHYVEVQFPAGYTPGSEFTKQADSRDRIYRYYLPAGVPTTITSIPEGKMLTYTIDGQTYQLRNGGKLTLTAPVSMTLAEETTPAHSCSNITSWTEYTSSLAAGQFYYLPSDVSTELTIPAGGTVTICLNGHTLSQVIIPENASLSLCSCQENGGVATLKQTGSVKLGSGVNVSHHLYRIFNPDSLNISGDTDGYASEETAIAVTVDAGYTLSVKSGGLSVALNTDGKSFSMPAATVTITARKSETVTDSDDFQNKVDENQDVDVEINTGDGDSIEIPGDHTGDITVDTGETGGDVTLEGDVGGDLDVETGSGGTTVTGGVGGDVTNNGGGETNVGGDVGGNVGTESGGTTNVGGSVEGDVTNNGGTTNVGGSVEGGVNNNGGDTTVDGDVGGVNNNGGNTTVGGSVSGDVSSSGDGSVTTGDPDTGTGGTVTGDVTTGGSGSADINGDVTGSVENNSSGDTTVDGNVGGGVSNSGSGDTTVGGNVSGGVTSGGEGNTTVNGNVTDGGVSNSGSGDTTVGGSVSGDVSSTGDGSVTTGNPDTGTGGDVTGDVTTGGSGSADINGDVTGSVENNSSGDTIVDGNVGGGVSNNGTGTTNVGGDVTGGVTSTGGETNVGGNVSNNNSDGNAITNNGGTTNAGSVTGDIDANGGTTNVTGDVDGNVEASGDNTKVEVGGNIDGNTTVKGGAEVTAGGTTAGTTTDVSGDGSTATLGGDSGTIAGDVNVGDGGKVTTTEGSTVTGDVTVGSGGSAEINGDIAKGGSVTVESGGEVTITGDVKGDLDVQPGGTVNFGGTETDPNDVTYNPPADTNLNVQDNATVTTTTPVQGDITVENGGKAEIDSGTSEGSKVTVETGGSANLGGEVAGDVTNNGGNVTTDPNTTVSGDITNTGGNVTTGSGSTVTGNVTTGEDGKTTVNGDTTGSVTTETGGSTTVNGDTTGSVTTETGGETNVNGTASGGVTNDGGTTTITGNVTDDNITDGSDAITNTGGATTVTGTVDGNVTNTEGTVTTGTTGNEDGTVTGDVTTSGTGSTTVNGDVEGAVSNSDTGKTEVSGDVTGGVTNNGGETTVTGKVTNTTPGENAITNNGGTTTAGSVTGNIDADGGTVNVTENVTGNIDADGGDTNVTGNVTGTVDATGENTTVDVSGTIGGNTTVTGGADITAGGTSEGTTTDVTGDGSTATLGGEAGPDDTAGTIAGDVNVGNGGKVTTTEGSNVTGNVTVEDGGTLDVDGTVNGNVVVETGGTLDLTDATIGEDGKIFVQPGADVKLPEDGSSVDVYVPVTPDITEGNVSFVTPGTENPIPGETIDGKTYLPAGTEVQVSGLANGDQLEITDSDGSKTILNNGDTYTITGGETIKVISLAYTITIPESFATTGDAGKVFGITVTAGSLADKTRFKIGLQGSYLFAENGTEVTKTGEFKLSHTQERSATIPYAVYPGTEAAGEPLGTNGALTVTANKQEGGGMLNLFIKPDADQAPYAGTYTGTMNFTVEIFTETTG